MSADLAPLVITRFDSLRTPVGTRTQIDWFDFCRSCMSPIVVASKHAAPLFAPVTLAGNYRSRRNVGQVFAACFDFDDLPPADPYDRLQGCRPIIGALSGYAALLYSTISHTIEAPRFRAVVPLSRPATAAEYEELAAPFVRMLTAQGVPPDPKCIDASRAWFVPAVTSNAAPFRAMTSNADKPIDVDKALENIRRQRTAEPAPVRPITSTSGARFERCGAYVRKMDPAISGSGGHNATFRAAAAIVQRFGLRGAEAWAVMCEFNERCQPRWSDRELRHKLAEAEKSSRVG